MKFRHYLIIALLAFALPACQTTAQKEPDPKKVEKKPGKKKESYQVKNLYWKRTLREAKKSFSLTQPSSPRALFIKKSPGDLLVIAGEKGVEYFSLSQKKGVAFQSWKKTPISLDLGEKTLAAAFSSAPPALYNGQKKEVLPFSAQVVALSPTQDILACGQKTQKWFIYSLDGKKKTFRRRAEGEIRELAFSPRGKWLALATASSLRIWRTDVWRRKGLIDKKKIPFNTFAFSPEDKHLALSTEKELILWDLYLDDREKEKKVDFSAKRLRYSPRGSILAVQSKDREIKFFTASQLEEVLTLREEEEIVDFRFFPHHHRLATLLKSGKIQIWKFSSSREEISLVRALKMEEANHHYQRGQEWNQKGKMARAKAHWKRALKFLPSHKEAKRELGRIAYREFRNLTEKKKGEISSKIQAGKIKEALTLYGELLDFPSYSNRRVKETKEELNLQKMALEEFLKGEELFKEKKMVQAYPYFRQSLRYNPTFDLARKREMATWEKYSASLSQEKKKKFLATRKKEQKKAEKKAEKKEKDPQNTRVAKGNPLEKDKKEKEVKKSSKKGEKGKNSDSKEKTVEVKKEIPPQKLWARAQSHSSQGKWEKALEIYQNLEQVSPWAQKAHLEMARIYLKKGNFVQSASYYEKVRPKKKLALSDLLALARCYQKLGKEKKELEIYRKLPPSQKNKAHWLRQAQVARKEQAWKVAEEAYSALLEKNPQVLSWRKERMEVVKKLASEEEKYLAPLARDLQWLAEKKLSYQLELANLYLKMKKVKAAHRALIEGYERAEKEGEKELKEDFARRLHNRGFLFTQNQWIDEKTYFRSEGLVQYKDQWVPPLKKKVLLKRDQDSPLPSRPSAEAKKKALEEGKLLKGMNRKDVTRVLGFWKDLSLVRQGKETYEILAYPDSNRYVYLKNGLVIDWN